MIPAYTPAHLTPLSFADAAAALRWALGNPKIEVLALALAKSALETWRWKSLWNSNFGNIRPRRDQPGMYTCLPICNELEGADRHVVWYSPEGIVASRTNLTVIRDRWPAPPAVGKDGGVGHPGSRFAAYANEFDGAQSYVDFVSGGHYKGAWAKLLQGDAAGYVHALKLAGYFTAEEGPYAAGVISMQREFMAKLNGLAPEEHHLDDHEWEAIRASIIGSSWAATQDMVHRKTDEEREEPGERRP